MRILFAAVAMSLLLVTGAIADTTNALSDAQIQGRQLARQLLEQSPATNFTQRGVLRIRNHDGTTNVFVSFQTFVTTQDWQTVYEASPDTNGVPTVRLQIIHQNGEPNRYQLSEDGNGLVNLHPVVGVTLHGNQTMVPFARSDFWIADLGLEFFHWPDQTIIKKEFRRNCACMVLESTNPDPSAKGYLRVDSWIDEQSGGIVMAKAYDHQGRLLKEFYPKDIKKVDGQWQVGTMQIDNVQTGSRTRLEFDLKK